MSWKRFFRRKRWDEERSRELDSYIETETHNNIARGMTPDEARYAARRKLGNPSSIREEIYRMNTLHFFDSLWSDLRYAARTLRLNPGFALVAIASLALGIGANTAIFQLLDSVRLRTLPVKDPQQLVTVRIPPGVGRRGNFSSDYPQLTFPLWEQIRDHSQAFSSMFVWSPRQFNLATGGEMRPSRGLYVSGDFFRTLGVEPIAGRLISSADDRPGCGGSAAVISYGFWQAEFGGSASAIGRAITLNNHSVEIVGITPASFFGVDVGRTFDVAIPVCSEPLFSGEDSQLARRDGWWLAAMGRLKPGWTIARATAEMGALSTGIFEATLPTNYPPEGSKSYLALKLIAAPADSGFSSLRQDYENPLWLLLSTAGLVLLIACANLANLMLARASAREREIAVRLAIGASRGRLIRQMLSESLLIATVGAGLGVLAAQNLSRFLVSFLSTRDNPRFVDLSTDWMVLGFTAALAILTCVLFGLTPALRASRTSPSAVIKANGRGMTAGRERFGLRRILVAAQLALSLVLLVGALLFATSLHNLLALDAGFQQNGILNTSVIFDRLKIPVERRLAFKRELLERVRAIPGVEAATAGYTVPIGGSWSNDTVLVGQQKKGESWTAPVMPGFFRTLEIPMLAGRDFNDHDNLDSPPVAIVNRAFAAQFFPGEEPLGKTFYFEPEPNKPIVQLQIIGLVKNIKYTDLRDEFRPMAFLSDLQDKTPGSDTEILMRSQLPPSAIVPAVKEAMAAVSPEIDLNFRVLKTTINNGLIRDRLMATLSGFFGLLAVLLSMIGLYGVMSYSVARRTNEIGIRMALGADWRAVIKLILTEATVLLILGLLAGTGLALAAGTAASSLLFGLKPRDPVTFAIAIGALGFVAVLASLWPAQRAARLDPMIALREE